MRDLDKVLKDMLFVIPVEETSFRDSINKLLDKDRHLHFSSSVELIYYRWQLALEIVSHFLPVELKDCNEWQKKAVVIWVKQPLEDVLD